MRCVVRSLRSDSDWSCSEPRISATLIVYRMDSLQELVGNGNWMLSLPITCRGVLLTEATLTGEGDARADEFETPRPILRLTALPPVVCERRAGGGVRFYMEPEVTCCR